jgi:hypothetical protein
MIRGLFLAARTAPFEVAFPSTVGHFQWVARRTAPFAAPDCARSSASADIAPHFHFTMHDLTIALCKPAAKFRRGPTQAE